MSTKKKSEPKMTIADLKSACWEFISESPEYTNASPTEKAIAEMAKPLIGLGLFGMICSRPDTDEVGLKEIVESLFQVREAMNKQLNE